MGFKVGRERSYTTKNLVTTHLRKTQYHIPKPSTTQAHSRRLTVTEKIKEKKRILFVEQDAAVLNDITYSFLFYRVNASLLL